MTDQGSGYTGTPQDAVPQDAIPQDTPPQQPAAQGGYVPTQIAAPPVAPQQPAAQGGYVPTELATPAVPQAQQQAQQPGAQPAQDGYVPTQLATPPVQQPQPAAPQGGYVPTQLATPSVPQPSQPQPEQAPYVPTQLATPPVQQPQAPQQQPGPAAPAGFGPALAPQPPTQPGTPQVPPGYGYPHQPPQHVQFAQQAAPQGQYAQPPVQQPMPPQGQYAQQAPPQGQFAQPMAPQQGQPYPGYQQPYPQAPGQPQQQPYGDPNYAYQPAPGGPGGPGYSPGVPGAGAAPAKPWYAGPAGIVIAGVAGLAVIGAVALVVTQGGSPKGPGGHSLPALSAGWNVPTASGEQKVLGGWVTSKYLIQGTDQGLNAYDLYDGHNVWHAVPDSGPSVPCAMSPTISASGIGTLGFGPDSEHCNSIVGIDTSTGRTMWTVTLTSKDNPTPVSLSTFVDGKVGVVVSDNAIGGIDLATGTIVWSHKDRGASCNDYPYGGGGVVLVDDFCADVDPTYTLTAYDAQNGAQLWRKTETDHTEIESVLSGPSPVVFRTMTGSLPVQVYDTSGNGKPLVPRSGEEFNNGWSMPANGGTTLLTLTQATADAISAFNLTTGEEQWSYDGQTHNGAVPVQSTPDAAGKVYAVSLADSSGGSPMLVQLDPATGKATPLASLPASDTTSSFSYGNFFLAPGDKLFAFPSESGSSVSVQAWK